MSHFTTLPQDSYLSGHTVDDRTGTPCMQTLSLNYLSQSPSIFIMIIIAVNWIIIFA